MHGKVLATTPVLIVRDLARSLAFYCEKLGFVEPATWGEPPSFGMCNRDGFDLMLSCPEEGAPPRGPRPQWDLHVRIDDVERERAALEAAGVAIVRGPETTFYDMIEIEVLDPDGHRICFGQDIVPRGPLPKGQGGSPGPLPKGQGGSPGPLPKGQGGSQ